MWNGKIEEEDHKKMGDLPCMCGDDGNSLFFWDGGKCVEETKQAVNDAGTTKLCVQSFVWWNRYKFVLDIFPTKHMAWRCTATDKKAKNMESTTKSFFGIWSFWNVPRMIVKVSQMYFWVFGFFGLCNFFISTYEELCTYLQVPEKGKIHRPKLMALRREDVVIFWVQSFFILSAIIFRVLDVL